MEPGEDSSCARFLDAAEGVIPAGTGQLTCLVDVNGQVFAAIAQGKKSL